MAETRLQEWKNLSQKKSNGSKILIDLLKLPQFRFEYNYKRKIFETPHKNHESCDGAPNLSE